MRASVDENGGKACRIQWMKCEEIMRVELNEMGKKS